MASIKLEVLECFALVAKLGSISEASRQLGISQPTVSRQIKSLEENLGVMLFNRETDGIALTEIGRRFLTQLSPLMTRLGTIMEEIAGVSESMSGEISLVALLAHGETILVPQIIKFREQYPDVEFKVEFLKEVEILEAIREGRADLGIVTTVPEGSWMRVHRLENERVVMVTNFSNPQNITTIAQLEKAKFVAYRLGDPLLELYCKKKFPGYHKNRLQTPIIVNSHRSIIDILRETDYFGVLPFPSVDSAVSNHILRIASEHELSGGLFLGYRASVQLTRRSRAFVEFIMEKNVPQQTW